MHPAPKSAKLYIVKSSKILLGVSGGIAAYKAAEIASGLTRAGHEVTVAMTPAATQFVTPMTFAALTRHRVLAEMFPDARTTEGDNLYPHLYPALHTDLFVVAPATADVIAKLAHGIADDVVCASALALPAACPRYFCPAMNSHMWLQPVTRENVRRLEQRGWIRIGPASGVLACGTHGEGRMSEPADILKAILEAPAPAPSALKDRTVLILSGPTREHLDPVRYIGNASSGRMGCALAEEAAQRGAHVQFITGPVDPARLPADPTIQITPVLSAADMLAAARTVVRSAAVIIHAAAVADFRPARSSEAKMPKADHPAALALESTPDIASELAALRTPGQTAIGFALESGDGRAQAESKLKRKRFDLVVLNGPPSMGADHAEFHALAAGGDWQSWGELDKRECARRILDFAERGITPSARGTPA